jgi:hypothetical protein
MKSPVSAIEELVRSVADSAAQGKVKVSERIEALRVLAPYYIALKKHKIDPSTDNDVEAVSIGRLQDAVRQAEDGNGQTVSDHKRRGRGKATVEN